VNENKEIIRSFLDALRSDDGHVYEPALSLYINFNDHLSRAEKTFVEKHFAECAVCHERFERVFDDELDFDSQRFEVKFTHLPSNCTIRIFTVSGDLVKTIKHNLTSNNDRVNYNPYDEELEPEAAQTSIEQWDLRTANGRYVASGMYIALIESEAGKRFVKFAIIQ
jgi:hypothetical protein